MELGQQGGHVPDVVQGHGGNHPVETGLGLGLRRQGGGPVPFQVCHHQGQGAGQGGPLLFQLGVHGGGLVDGGKAADLGRQGFQKQAGAGAEIQEMHGGGQGHGGLDGPGNVGHVVRAMAALVEGGGFVGEKVSGHGIFLIG